LEIRRGQGHFDNGEGAGSFILLMAKKNEDEGVALPLHLR